MKVTEEVKDGFWINPYTFRKNKVREEVPDGTVIVTSTEKDLDDGRTVFEKDFYLAEDLGPQKVGKKEASVRLKSQMQEFMISKGRWTPNTTIKQIMKNGKVRIAFHPDPFVEFSLVFEAEVAGESTEHFLNSLAEEAKPLMIWRVEHAKSSRATCRKCGWNIGKGTVRIGKPELFREYITHKWYHVECAQEEEFVLEPVEGMEKLTKEERQQLNDAGLIPDKS
ncbi:MAG: PARP-type zinc finger-containing protein [Candidatus Hodarchaeota archaeon]